MVFLAPLLLLVSCHKPAAPVTVPPGQALYWTPSNPNHEATNGEVGVRFTFTAQNISATEVVITDLKSSCGCTVAEMPEHPWRIKPGATAKFDAVMDLRDKTGVMSPAGVIYKDIQVVGEGFTNDLKFSVAVPPTMTNNLSKAQLERLWGQQLTVVDHQAVFKRDCVKCHLVPAFGKYDERLFHTACGICHESSQRASFVPDLATLTNAVDTNYWRQMVALGKPGTMMPGFASAQGGPLDADQVDSLAAYLAKTFPRPVKAATNSAK
jgi:cytochrome c553